MTFIQKRTRRDGKLTVRTQGFLFTKKRGVRVDHLQSEGKNYNIYTMTENAFWKQVEGSEDLIQNWDESIGLTEKAYQQIIYTRASY